MKRVNPGAYRLARACGIRKRKLAVILGFKKLGVGWKRRMGNNHEEPQRPNFLSSWSHVKNLDRLCSK